MSVASHDPAGHAEGLLAPSRPSHAETGRPEERIPGTQATYRALISHLPAVTYISAADETGTPLWFSPGIDDLLGYGATDFTADPDLWNDLVHEEDRERVRAEEQKTIGAGDLWRSDYRMRARDGRVVWIRDAANIVFDDDGTPLYWEGFWIDITEQKQAEDAVRRRDAILQAVSFSAERFMRSSSWEDCADEVLAALGVATEVSRVYIFENHDGPDGEPLMFELFEWCAPGIGETLSDPENQGWPYLPDYSRWLEDFRAGRAIVGRREEFPDSERRDFDDESILSTAFLPVFVGETWWGYIGFDDCVTARTWAPTEMDALRAAAGILGAAVRAQVARAELAQAHERFQGFMEQIPAMLYIEHANDDDPAIYVSSYSNEILGVSPETYIGDLRWWQRHVHPEDRGRVRAEYLRFLETGEGGIYDYRIVRDDGSTVWVHDRSTVLRDEAGGAKLLQGVLIDNTDHKRAELALEDALRRESEAVARLRELDDMKTGFLHAVSHDLRTPLAAILGLSVTLERGDELRLPADEVVELSARIGANARKLDRLLADLLDLDRMDRGIVEPRRASTDIGALVRRTVRDTDLLGAREIHVQADPVMADVDASKIERIVENLVHNAAKYTSKDATVWVRVTTDPGGGVSIAVEDDGPGVPEADRERIFEAFARGNGPEHAPGTGIGLSLVARFASLHGGRAWVEDRPGGGASFRVWLPAGAAD
jgi:PAS domain S-box-containing protein